MTTSSSTFERSNRVMKVTMCIKIKVDRMIEKIVDAPAHNCSVLLSILMDIEWMSTKKKSVIIVHDVKSSERKSFITPSTKVATRRYQRTGKMKEKVEIFLMVLMQKNGSMIITPE